MRADQFLGDVLGHGTDTRANAPPLRQRSFLPRGAGGATYCSGATRDHKFVKPGRRSRDRGNFEESRTAPKELRQNAISRNDEGLKSRPTALERAMLAPGCGSRGRVSL